MPFGAPPSELPERVAAVVHNAGFSGTNLVTAIAIAKAESGWKWDAKGGPNSNGTYDWGLFQINDVHKPSANVKTNPVANAKEAHRIFVAAGNSFKPWATYNSGAYKAHMKEAQNAVTALQKKGPAWERATVKSLDSSKATMTDSAAQSQNVTDVGDAISSVPNAIRAVGNAISSQFGKVAGNVLTIIVAVVLLVLGVVILLRGSVTDMATKTVRKALG